MGEQGLLEELIGAWAYAREGVIAETRNIDASDWSFRPTDASRNVGQLARHILESAFLAVGEITRPDGDFTRQGFEEHIREYAGHLPERPGRDELLEMLGAQLEEGAARLREFGESGILMPIRQFNGEPARRLTWFNHHIAHEEYHRGQLALYARLTGRVPALTQRIQGAG